MCSKKDAKGLVKFRIHTLPAGEQAKQDSIQEQLFFRQPIYIYNHFLLFHVTHDTCCLSITYRCDLVVPRPEGHA